MATSLQTRCAEIPNPDSVKAIMCGISSDTKGSWGLQITARIFGKVTPVADPNEASRPLRRRGWLLKRRPGRVIFDMKCVLSIFPDDEHRHRRDPWARERGTAI